jgi:thioredoxin reductase
MASDPEKLRVYGPIIPGPRSAYLAPKKPDVRYCIVGAGPAGIQLGYLLARRGADFAIFERQSQAGGIFAQFEDHRKLVTAGGSADAALAVSQMDHWEDDKLSLWSDDPSLRMAGPQRPTGRQYAQYLATFAKQVELKIRFDTEVKIRRKRRALYLLELVDAKNPAKSWGCKVVILATGLQAPFVPPIIADVEGIIAAKHPWEEAVGGDLTRYKDAKVAILGAGNSAWEAAMAVEPMAASVTVFGWRPLQLKRAAQTTGWLSGTVTDWLDRTRVQVIEGNFSMPTVVKRSWGYIIAPGGTPNPTERNIRLFEQLQEQLRTGGGPSMARAIKKHPAIGAQYMSFMQGQGGGDWGWHTATQVIRCTGWAFDEKLTPVWGDRPLEAAAPEFDSMGKYPLLMPDYGLVGQKHMYVAGIAAHGEDHHTSGGGAVAGFRYSVRALDRWLGFRYDNASWVGTTRVPAVRPMLLADKILARASSPEGLTAMHKRLLDILVFTVSATGGLQALWYPEMPRAVAHGLTSSEFVVSMAMEYLSEGVAQPVLRFYPPGRANVTHHDPESIHTVAPSLTVPPTWNSEHQLLPLVAWLKPIIRELKGQVAARVNKRKEAMERRTKKGVKSGDFKGLTLSQLFSTTNDGPSFLDRQNQLYDRYS